MRQLIALAATVAVIVACLPVARAAGAWEATPVPGSGMPALTDLALGFGPDGTGLIGWTSSFVLPGPFASVVGPAGPGAARSLARLPVGRNPSRGAQLVGRRQMAVVGADLTIEGAGPAWLGIGPIGGSLGPQRTIARHAEVASVAAGPRGELAVAMRVMQPTRPGAGSTLRVLVRRPNGRRQSVRVTRNAALAAMAFNRRGDLLIAYDRTRSVTVFPDLRHRIEARLLPSHGRLRQAQLVGRAATESGGTGGASLTAALARDRRALIGWNLMNCGEGGTCSPAALHVALARRGGRFGQGRLLARLAGGKGAHPGPVLVAAGEDGRSTVAWSAQLGSGLALLRAEVIGRHLGPAVRVSTPDVDAQPAALASGPDGSTALLWTEALEPFEFPRSPPSRLLATVRSGRARFGSPESVTDQPIRFGDAVALAIDPAHDRPAAVWQGFADPVNAPPVPFLMFARR
jgi:hypothetical protein